MSVEPPAAPQRLATAEEMAAAAQTRRNGTRAGLAVIAFGVVTAIILYFIQRGSPNFVREKYAVEFAIMYAAFCIVAGIIVIRWFNRMAPDDTTALLGARAPTKEQTWKRRKGTLVGLLVIALGLLTAMITYLVDTSSPFDFFRMTSAMDMAIVHAGLWGFVGVVMILYHNRQAPDHATNIYDPNDRSR